MSFLPQAQVCVIDDEVEEYKHLLGALSSEGIGWVHVAGDKVESLPPKPLEGLRIVFLDMHLGTDASKSQREVTAHTANVFTHVVSASSGPLAVIVWTKRADYIESFRQSLFEARPEFRGRLFFVRWEKPVPASKIVAAELKAALHQEMSNLGPLALLWGWDKLVHRAASDVIFELSRLSAMQADLQTADTESEERDKLLKSLNSVLARLIHAETGKSGVPADAPVALQRTLEPLLADRVDHISPKPELDTAQQIFSDNLVQAEAPASVLIEINSMLLVGTAGNADTAFRPGTLYKVSDIEAFKTATGIGVIDLVREICQKTIADDDTKRTAFIADCHVVLFEVSPACDFAQGKRPLARLVAGLLMPSSRVKEIKKPRDDGYSALRVVPAEIRVDAIAADKSWNPVFTSALVLSWPEKNPAPFLTPVGRFKEPLLLDFRNWLAH